MVHQSRKEVNGKPSRGRGLGRRGEFVKVQSPLRNPTFVLNPRVEHAPQGETGSRYSNPSTHPILSQELE